eukprot:gene14775-biopygen8126
MTGELTNPAEGGGKMADKWRGMTGITGKCLKGWWREILALSWNLGAWPAPPPPDLRGLPGVPAPPPPPGGGGLPGITGNTGVTGDTGETLQGSAANVQNHRNKCTAVPVGNAPNVPVPLGIAILFVGPLTGAQYQAVAWTVVLMHVLQSVWKIF